MPDKLLVIIESPGKIQKVSQYLKDLGYDAIVKASMGHIRELADAGKCNRGFDLEDAKVQSHWQVNSGKKKNVEDIRKLTKGRTVVLATDGDREGESISWHLAEVLKLKSPQRMVYQEITKDAIGRALKQLRPLDMGLVGAALARARLDKDVGYCGTQLVVWPLNIGARSMGRVQTAALAIATERERQIRTFKPQNYYSLSVDYAEGFKAFYRATRSQPAPAGSATEEDVARDDAQESGEDKQSESDRITSQQEAERIVAIARQNPHQVITVEQKQAFQRPPEPFTTSTLQQAAGTRFKYRPDKTMELAQKLYEGGFITYMRTDSVALAETFCASVRKYLEQTDPKNVPQKTAQFRNKAGAQEAHEAVRPTDITQTPEKLKGQLPDEQLSLYALIWQRTLATQCAPAELNKGRVVVQAGSTTWEARGQTVVYAGYTRYTNSLNTSYR
ncbi:MAG: type IA DNA topoisomerase (plasmid) [Leptolyngbya sp. BL-A-14]